MRNVVLVFLVLFSMVAVGQKATPSPVQATNLVEKQSAPSYADLYCAGFISKAPIGREMFVAAGSDTPGTALYGTGSAVFLKGPGYQPDQVFTVVRPMYDVNRYETFAGQHSLVHDAGTPYAEIARVRVVKITMGDHSAVARVEFNCQAITPGDLVIPFQEKQQISYRGEKRQFDRFPPPAAIVGRVVLAKDFDTFVGTGKILYINAGADKGIKPGDYLRATRGYAPDDMDAAATLGYNAGIGVEYQSDTPKITRDGLRSLPRQAIGELIVLSVTPTSATAMITLSLDAIHVGDNVEFEGPQQ